MCVKIWWLAFLGSVAFLITRLPLIVEHGYCVPQKEIIYWTCPVHYSEMNFIGNAQNLTYEGCCRKQQNQKTYTYHCTSKIPDFQKVDTIGWMSAWLLLSILLSFPLSVYIVDKYVLEKDQIVYGDDLKVGFIFAGLIMIGIIVLGLLSEFLLVRPLLC